ncbi:hypothetical protein [Streptomyces sp. NPDC090029]|uniref:hypothetical protein n=1 Tax=Streptomyces sp. NPDC090029 TaxID=3365924 RepID=UPI0037FBE85C
MTGSRLIERGPGKGRGAVPTPERTGPDTGIDFVAGLRADVCEELADPDTSRALITRARDRLSSQAFTTSNSRGDHPCA